MSEPTISLPPSMLNFYTSQPSFLLTQFLEASFDLLKSWSTQKLCDLSKDNFDDSSPMLKFFQYFSSALRIKFQVLNQQAMYYLVQSLCVPRLLRATLDSRHTSLWECLLGTLLMSIRTLVSPTIHFFRTLLAFDSINWIFVWLCYYNLSSPMDCKLHKVLFLCIFLLTTLFLT